MTNTSSDSFSRFIKLYRHGNAVYFYDKTNKSPVVPTRVANRGLRTAVDSLDLAYFLLISSIDTLKWSVTDWQPVVLNKKFPFL